MLKYNRRITASVGLVAAGTLVITGCGLGNGAETNGHGNVKSKSTPSSVKAAMKNADCRKTKDAFGADDMGAIGQLGVTDIQGCINDEGTQLVFGTVKKHKQVKKVLNAFADSEGTRVWGADIDGDKLFGLAHSREEMKGITGEMNVEEVHAAEKKPTKTKTKTKTAKPKPDKTSESKSDESDEPNTSDEDQSVPLKGNATYKFKDGVTVEMVEGANHTGSGTDVEVGEVKQGQQYMTYQIKVTNDTKKPLDTLTTAELRYGEKGKSAEELVTSESEDSDIDGKIQPGHSATGKYSFDVNPQAKKVVLDVDPDMEHEVTFVGE